jgi:hypothetical protein
MRLITRYSLRKENAVFLACQPIGSGYVLLVHYAERKRIFSLLLDAGDTRGLGWILSGQNYLEAADRPLSPGVSVKGERCGEHNVLGMRQFARLPSLMTTRL